MTSTPTATPTSSSRRPTPSSLFRGGANGPAAGTSLPAAGQSVNPRHAAAAGDLDGDGRSDILIGDSAAVEALFGTASGLDRSRVRSATPPGGLSGSID